MRLAILTRLGYRQTRIPLEQENIGDKPNMICKTCSCVTKPGHGCYPPPYEHASVTGHKAWIHVLWEEGPAPDLVELADIDPSFVARYGRVLIRRGVATVPWAVYTHQAQLGLSPYHIWFITYIFSFQWDTGFAVPEPGQNG